MTRPISRFYRGSPTENLEDHLIVEEPLEIRLNSEPMTITMRTPGHDLELAAGLLLCEGVIQSSDDIETIRHCSASNNIVRVDLRPGIYFDSTRLNRNFLSSSSCGLCGKASLEALALRCSTLPPLERALDPELIISLPNQLRGSQELFRLTGSSHSAGLFSGEGKLLSTFEDVGRHNAVDKLIGHQLLNGVPIAATDIMCISGRASFEILQKAISARIGTIVAVGAPSSLAVEMACQFNVELIGFVSSSHFNLYQGARFSSGRVAAGGGSG
jgi:FdhD protein